MYLCAKNKVENSVKAFRLISSMEAISFLVLLGIAMPLKYIWDMPGMVQSIGWIHGLLFVLYIIGALVMYKKFKWSLSVLAIVMVCSLLPFGPFYAERKYLPNNA
jgi:integral membrane protein